MQIGKYKISYLETGTLGLDGGAMFGVFPNPFGSGRILLMKKTE